MYIFNISKLIIKIYLICASISFYHVSLYANNFPQKIVSNIDISVPKKQNFHNNKPDNIHIAPYVIEIFKPIDLTLYSEFNLSIPVDYRYIGDYENNITLSLEEFPNGMSLIDNRILWTPKLSQEGKNHHVKIKISDGHIYNSISFDFYVAKPKLIQTAIENNKLIITDQNSTLKGLTIAPAEDMNLENFKLYSITQQFKTDDTVLAKMLVKGNIGKRVKLSLNIKKFITPEELLSFHIKGYLGLNQFHRIDYNRTYSGSVENPIYEIDTYGLFGVIIFSKEPQLSNKISLTHRIRRKNLISTINGQNMCSVNATFTKKTLVIKGSIAPKYRDKNLPQRYIDTIKIKDINSGTDYVVQANSNGNWEKTISYEFNSNNIAPIEFEGYNSSNMNQLIYREGINITHG